MNFLTALVLFSLSLSAAASTLLECKPAQGNFQTREIIIGNIVITADEVMLFQQAPVFENVTFEVKKSVSEDGFTTFVKERVMEEVITLDLQDSGIERIAFLTRESDMHAEEYFYERIMMKCKKLN